MEKQQAGLSDALALLNSPCWKTRPSGSRSLITDFRYVRVNQFLAEMNQVAIGRGLGSTITECSLSVPLQSCCRSCIQRIFAFETGPPVIEFELNTPFSQQ